MRYLRSIQLKAMVCMVTITAISVVVIDGIYQTWLNESERRVIEGRLERALFSYGPTPQTESQAYNQLVQLARRFDLAGVACVDAQTGRVTGGIGLVADPRRVNQWIERESQTASVFVDPALGVPEDDIFWGIRRLQGPGGAPVLLAVAVSREHGIVTRESLSHISWITLVGSVLVAMLFSYLLRRMVTQPVNRLSGALTQVAGGDLSQKVDTNVDVELQGLVANFNLMIDELQQSRNKIEDYQNSLEDRIERARQELERKEAELIQAEKLASVGQLAAGVAHEINNPIYYITLTADLLREDVKDADSRKRVEQIAAQARRCRKIVKDLLEYSRQGAPIEGAFDLNQVIERSVREHTDQGLLQEVSIDLDLAPGLPQICGVSDEVRRVVDIMLQNSLQAANGNGKITVQTRLSQAHGVQLVIRDNGPGMSPEVKSRAFEPFFTTKDVGQGTGLGLSIAYGIVARHRGSIAIESDQGQGTAVTVCLPVVQPDGAAPPQGE